MSSCKQASLLTIVLREYENNSIRATKDRIGDGASYSFLDGRFLGIAMNDTSRNKKVIFGRLLGDVYGHRFEFDKQKILSRYIFDVDGGAHYSYGVELLKDTQYSETGNPYVDRWKDESYVSRDSIRYVLLFSKFPRKNVQAFYSYDSTSYQNLNLENSRVMPYLAEGKIIVPNTMKVINLKIEAEDLLYPLNGLQEKKVFLEIKVYN